MTSRIIIYTVLTLFILSTWYFAANVTWVGQRLTTNYLMPTIQLLQLPQQKSCGKNCISIGCPELRDPNTTVGGCLAIDNSYQSALLSVYGYNVFVVAPQRGWLSHLPIIIFALR